MNTKKKSLKILLCLVLMMSVMLIGTVAASAYSYVTTVDRVVASGDWEPEYYDEVSEYRSFRVTEGDDFLVEQDPELGTKWEKYNASTDEWEEYTGYYFGCGKYRLSGVFVYLDYYSYYYDMFEFDDDTKFIINGEEWTVGAYMNYPDSRIGAIAYLISPEVELCYGGTATCKDKAVCENCGESYGETLSHTGGTATCKEKAKCTVCGEGYGELAPHKGGTATCKDKAKCTVCGEGYGSLAAHKGGTATCKAKAKCTVCGVSYGNLNASNHKNIKTLGAVSATCGKTGKTAGKQCADCGKVTVAQKSVAATGKHSGGTATCKVKAKCKVCGQSYGSLAAHKGGKATCKAKAKCSVCGVSYGSLKAHSYKDVTTKATLKKDGKIENKCTVCGKVSKKTTINKPEFFTLSDTYFTYNGKVKTPTVTVKDSKGKKLKKDTDYTVKYSKGRKSIGSYTATVTFKGKYSGTKKLTFKIVLGAPTLSKLTSGKKQITPTWKTVSGASGYEVQYSTSEKFTKKTTKKVTIKKGKTTKTTIKKLSEGTTYYVKVRAYKTVNKKKVYSAYSAVKSVRINRVLTAKEKQTANTLNQCRRYCAYLYYDAKLLQNAITLYRITGSTRDYIKVVNYLSDCVTNMNKIYNLSKDDDRLFMLKIHADYDTYPSISPSSLASAASFATKCLRTVSMYNIMCGSYNLEPINTSD